MEYNMDGIRNLSSAIVASAINDYVKMKYLNIYYPVNEYDEPPEEYYNDYQWIIPICGGKAKTISRKKTRYFQIIQEGKVAEEFLNNDGLVELFSGCSRDYIDKIVDIKFKKKNDAINNRILKMAV